MTTPLLTVDLDPADPAVRPAHRAALATVPGRFRIAAGRPADVAVVSGRSADWPATVTAAIEAGSRAILLTRPEPADPAAVDAVVQLAARADVRVAVDTSYAGHRTWTAARPELRAGAAGATLLDSVVCVPANADRSLSAALLDQLAVVRPILEGTPSLQPVHRSSEHYVLQGSVGSLAVNLVGLVSADAAESLRVDLVAPGEHWRVRFGAPDDAAPVDVERFDESGGRSLPQTFQTSRRQIWVDLHATLTGTPSIGYPIADLAADSALAAELLDGHHPDVRRR